jgi:hydroxymethylpyrimidine pyrophosphatase-like HAD family hydrolase
MTDFMTKQMAKPLFLIDLDDTILQTARKMSPDEARHVAALDKHGQPLSFTNNTQRAFIDWLLATADVVPVTARSVDAFKRVQLPFSHGAICAHGAVMLNANGDIDEIWHNHTKQQLEKYRVNLHEVQQQIVQIGDSLDFSLRTWIVEEQGIATYALAKHNHQGDDVLISVENQLQQVMDLSDFYIHRNANNLAILPNALHKKFAVQEWLRRDREQHGERPVLGFGDSLSDMGFLQECHWWATPRQGQLAEHIYQSLVMRGESL